MKIPFVDLTQQHAVLRAEIDAAIADVIDKNAFLRGPYVEKFENEFKKISQTEHCISCANGTDAIYIAMKALDIKPGDEVITTAHTWISTSETITQAGGRVVFCDTDRDTHTIDPAHIESKITDRTVGIIPVHLYGQSADMEAIMSVARKNDLWVIEDCAQAHLADFKGQRVGTFGDAATYSFYPGKNLGAMGDAGCIVTNDSKVADYCEIFARHGGKGNHQIEGINSRMDGIQAAVLCVKMGHLDEWTNSRRRAADKYSGALSSINSISTPTEAADRKHVYHLYVVQSDYRDNLRSYLTDNNIPTVLNYPRALPYYDAYKYLNHTPEDFPAAFSAQSRILSLPIFPEITDEQIEFVCQKISDFKI